MSAEMCVGLNIKCSLRLSISNKISKVRKCFVKVPNIKFQTNFLHGFRDVTMGQTGTQTEDRSLHSHCCEKFRFHNDGENSSCRLEVQHELQETRRRLRVSDSVKQRGHTTWCSYCYWMQSTLSRVSRRCAPTETYRDISWKYFTRRFLSSEI
jgi:hypothetical protein